MTQQGTGCSMPSADFDAIVVGAGFGGMYMRVGNDSDEILQKAH